MNALSAIGLTANFLTLSIAAYAAYQFWQTKGTESFWARIGFIPAHPNLSQVLVGAAIGTVAMTLLFAAEVSMGFVSVRAIRFPLFELTQWLVVFALGATAEELLNRCLALNGLWTYSRNGLIAVLGSSALFGLGHAGHEHATWLSVVITVLGGINYGFAFVVTRKIWLPLGLHFAWNFVQGSVLGFPVSGMAMKGVLELGGGENVLMTGGAYGPEGGLIGLCTRVLVFGMLFGVWHRTLRTRE